MIWALWLWGSAFAAPSAGPQWTTVLPWSAKVRPGVAVSGSDRAHLTAAGGECEAFQLYAAPPLEAVDARASPLDGPGGALELRIYREAFVPVEIPSNSQGAQGLWPDPLIPVEDAYYRERRRALPFPSSAERPLVLYVEACVPHEQPAGTYRGWIELSAEGHHRARLSVSVEVLPFSLPATSSLPNAFGLSLYSIAKGHGLKPESDEARALLNRYATALLAHRLSPFGLSMEPPPAKFERGEAHLSFADYDREVGPFLAGQALPSGARFTSADVREAPKRLTDEERILYYRAFREHFVQRGWKAQLFYYAKDEPKPEDYPLVLAQSARVHQAGGIPVLVTSPPDDRTLVAADIVCPVLNCLFERPGPKTCAHIQTLAALRKKLPTSAKVWWYQSCLSHGCDGGPIADPQAERAFSGWASYMVDHPATLNRAMGVLAFLAGVDGELYWDTAYAYQKQDPWNGVFAFGGNGDGTLFYPGSPAKIGGTHPIPIESLRLKTIREGLEDYEYFRLLAQTQPELARKSAQRLARSGYEIEADPSVWDAVRAETSQALQFRTRAESKRAR